MHQEETTPSIIDQHLKGVTTRLLWSMFICTVVGCSTILTVYYNMRLDAEKMRLEIRMINMRIDRLENGK